MKVALRPSRFPKTSDDLEPWRVYADALLGQGDPLGELITRELAGEPTDALMARRGHVSRYLRATFELGYVRTLTILSPQRHERLRGEYHRHPLPAEAELEAALRLLKTERCALLERLALRISPNLVSSRLFKKLMGVLPRSCTCLAVEDVKTRSSAEGAFIAGSLGPTITTLELHLNGGIAQPDWFRSERLRLDVQSFDLKLSAG